MPFPSRPLRLFLAALAIVGGAWGADAAQMPSPRYVLSDVQLAALTNRELVLFSGGKACSKLRQSCTTGYTYYVNSATGNNGNSGTSFGLPLKDVTSLPSLTAGQSVCLEGGSWWREQLTIGVANVMIAGCGTGALPIFDASDVIPNANFTADGSGGYTATIAPVDVGDTGWINAYETGGPGDSATGQTLANVASQALCDSTAGSYWVNGQTTSWTIPASVTICVHPTDSSNAKTNGYTYEFSSRAAGLTGNCRRLCGRNSR